MLNTMSTFEKIVSAAIVAVLIVAVFFSYHEIKETRSGFEESFGQDFKIGAFSAVVNKDSSDVQEENCKPLRPVIITALHDLSVSLGMSDTFEVNEQALQLFCKKNVTITLSDPEGNTLLLQKVEFVKSVPQSGTDKDEGTKVRINATVIHKGGAVPKEPTAYAEVLIPDRFLDTDDL